MPPRVVMRYRGMDGRDETEAAKVDALLDALRKRPQQSRGIVRRLQPYIIGVRQRLLDRYVGEGLAVEIMPDLWEWHGKYDAVRGLGNGEADIERLVL